MTHRNIATSILVGILCAASACGDDVNINIETGEETSETSGFETGETETGELEDSLPSVQGVFCFEDGSCFAQYSQNVTGRVLPSCEVEEMTAQMEVVPISSAIDCQVSTLVNNTFCVQTPTDGTTVCFGEVEPGWWAILTHECNSPAAPHIVPVWERYSELPECSALQPEIDPFFKAGCFDGSFLCFGEIESGWQVEIQPACTLFPKTGAPLKDCQ